MAVLELPVTNETSHYSFQVELEGTVYFFEFYYNTRSQLWIFDLLDQSELPILVGQPVIGGQLLADGFMIEGMPAGKFIAIDTTGADRSPDRQTLGNEVKFCYIESATVAEVSNG